MEKKGLSMLLPLHHGKNIIGRCRENCKNSAKKLNQGSIYAVVDALLDSKGLLYIYMMPLTTLNKWQGHQEQPI